MDGSDLLIMWRYFITILGVLFSLTFPDLVARLELPLFMLVIATVGMAHGSLDHLINGKDLLKTSWSSYLKFYLAYLIVAALIAIIWWTEPLIGLAIFLISSAYHFGQAELIAQSQSKWSARFFRLFWGLSLLFIPIYIHADSMLEGLLSLDYVGENFDLSSFSLIGLIISTAALVIIPLSGLLPVRTAVPALLSLLALSSIFYFTPFLYGFALYFGIWHAWPALITASKELGLKNPSSWIKALAPNYLAATLGLLVWIFSSWSLDQSTIISGALILLSALTVPHLYVFEPMYSGSKSSRVNP